MRFVNCQTSLRWSSFQYIFSFICDGTIKITKAKVVKSQSCKVPSPEERENNTLTINNGNYICNVKRTVTITVCYLSLFHNTQHHHQATTSKIKRKDRTDITISKLVERGALKRKRKK